MKKIKQDNVTDSYNKLIVGFLLRYFCIFAPRN